jgi:hypothetical protein
METMAKAGARISALMDRESGRIDGIDSFNRWLFF